MRLRAARNANLRIEPNPLLPAPRALPSSFSARILLCVLCVPCASAVNNAGEQDHLTRRLFKRHTFCYVLREDVVS